MSRRAGTAAQDTLECAGALGERPPRGVRALLQAGGITAVRRGLLGGRGRLQPRNAATRAGVPGRDAWRRTARLAVVAERARDRGGAGDPAGGLRAAQPRSRPSPL